MVNLVSIDQQARDGMAHRWVWRHSHAAVLVGFPPASARSPPGGGCRPSASVPGRCATPCGNAPRRPDRSVPELLGRGVQELVGLTVETAWFTANSIRHRTLLL